MKGVLLDGVVVVEGGGNVSVKEHRVRDTRQQMERGGPERLTAAIHQREEAAGGETLCPLNNYQNLIRRSGNNVL